MNLTARETEALDSLCDTFLPSLAFERDEDPALFTMSARDLGVAALVAEALERIEPAKRDAFRLFLRLLENPLFIATVSANATRFSRLSQAARERVLQRLSRSAVQNALGRLQRRQLIATSRAHPTAVPLHRVLRPWLRPHRHKL